MLNTFIFIIALIVVFVVISKFNNRGITQVGPERVKEMLLDGAVTILDVRTPHEFAKGHIKGARLIPLAEISTRIGELSSVKERQVLVYCLSGHRSAAASQILRKNGFARISNLRGGISAWNSGGNTTVKGD